MARPATDIADQVAARARGLNAYIQRMEVMYGKGEVSRTDLHRAHAGAFVAYQAYLESSLEKLFLGILMGRLTAAGARPLVAIASESVARKVIAGGRNYADWIPYEPNTKKRAIAFLASGKPFAALPTVDQRTLDRLGTLRNALAHDSSWSQRQFKKQFIGSKALPVDQRSPAGYLRGTHTVGQSRFSFHLAEGVAVFRRLCA